MVKDVFRFISTRFQTIFLDYKVQFKPRYGHGNPPHQELYSIINKNRDEYSSFLSTINNYVPQLSSIKKQSEESDINAPCWNNNFLPGLDIAALYTMIADKKPKRYIEVGSGNSTKVAYKAKQDHVLNTEIISIDPMPRAEIDHLADKVIRKPFEDTSHELILDLDAGDILFIDNSHRILPNSDAMVFFMEVLPKLKEGVIVHIHDIYLPYDYPQFMCDRAYSEQYGLAFYLIANPKKFYTIFPNYFVSEDKELNTKLDDLWNSPNLSNVERHGGSYWLEIRNEG